MVSDTSTFWKHPVTSIFMFLHLPQSEGSHRTDFLHWTKTGGTCRPKILLWSTARETMEPCEHWGLSSTSGQPAEQTRTLLLPTGVRANLRQQKAPAGALRSLTTKTEPKHHCLPHRSPSMEQTSQALQLLSLQPPTASTFPVLILASTQAQMRAGCIPLLLPSVLSVCSLTSLM